MLNGIVENYRELREQLIADGHTFTSETDAEVVVHLLEQEYDGDLVQALIRVYPQLEGHFTIVAIHHDQPDLLVGVRHQTPLVVGLGDGENFLASNVAAFLSETRRAVFPDDGEVVEITPAGVRFFRDGVEVEHPAVEELDWDDEARREGRLRDVHAEGDLRAARGGARDDRRPRARPPARCSRRSASPSSRCATCAASSSSPPAPRTTPASSAATSSRSGRALPVEPDIASEWIYRNPVLSKDTLVIGISQSGESRDTVNAVKLARERGARTLAITNMMGTQITREVDATLYTRCGIEIGVAASKTFTAQVALLSLLALKLAEIRQTLPQEEIDFILDRLHELPDKIAEFLDGRPSAPIDEIAQRFYDKPFFLYLGRHIGLPVALEGALKLKEISYIPTDAYSAGEMKHGPIAMLDEGTPVVVVATNIHVYDKIVSNIQETRARGAHVIAIATDGNEDIQHHADDVIYVPRTPAFLQAALAVVPLQLLAYRIARLRGLNVDQPRNLAKTVTVE